MGYCSYSSQIIVENKIQIDNLFITSFMPYASGECVKVYLYGLLMCNDSNQHHNTLDQFCKALNMSEQDIESAFVFWQEQGLVQIMDTIPKTIKYLPTQNAKTKPLKISQNKYESFNLQLQEIITDRMIMPHEFYEFYVTMESLHIEPSAMIMITKYCADIKGPSVGYPYILTVAKNWANDGYTTAEKVNEKLLDYEKQNENLNLVLKAMGIKRNADTTERDLLKKWEKMDFELGTIIYVIKSHKKLKKSVNFSYIDNILEKYYTMRLFSIIEIDEYEKNKQELSILAKSICKNLGVYYEDIEPVLENYVVNWKNLGYDDETLLKISNYCFKSSIRTLEYMDKQILKFYKLGIINSESLDNYFNDILDIEAQIKQILDKLGLNRNVNNYDREYYRNWKNNWNMSDELINHASSIANSKPQALVYMNKILSNWHQNNVTTIEQANNYIIKTEESPKTQFKQYTSHSYTNAQIATLFTNLEEVEI